MSNRTFCLQAKSEDASVVACVDGSGHAGIVAQAGAMLAMTLDRPLTLLRVVEPGGDHSRRPDPIEWDLHLCQARRELMRLQESLPSRPSAMFLEVVAGERVQTICERSSAPGTILVLGAPVSRDQRANRTRTAQQVLEAGAEAVFIVPIGMQLPDSPFARILVPLDGSSHADAALAEASRIARKSGGELLLAHVVPEAGITLFGPPDSTDLDLRLQIDQRNETAASRFLERTRRRFADQGLKVESRCFKGETRSTLQQAILEERPGLVVLSARGHGGRHCHDLSLGSTATYLLAHLSGPMLLVHPAAAQLEQQVRQVVETRKPIVFAA